MWGWALEHSEEAIASLKLSIQKALKCFSTILNDWSAIISDVLQAVTISLIYVLACKG